MSHDNVQYHDIVMTPSIFPMLENAHKFNESSNAMSLAQPFQFQIRDRYFLDRHFKSELWPVRTLLVSSPQKTRVR